MPSAVKIGADGSCTTGKDLVDRPVSTRSKAAVCRWCGGAIQVRMPDRNCPTELKWEHVGEKLSHPAEPR